MIIVCREYADPTTHQFITELCDSFGKKMLIQTRILDADHAPEVEAAQEIMRVQESAFINTLKEKHGYTDAQIAAMQKQPGDCGCK